VSKGKSRRAVTGKVGSAFEERCAVCYFAHPDYIGREGWCTYPGGAEVSQGVCLSFRPRQYCFACGISIGPFYLEKYPFEAGDKMLCGYCFRQLRKWRYLYLDVPIDRDKVARLLPDGRVEQS
jgi:hypothetical protein